MIYAYVFIGVVALVVISHLILEARKYGCCAKCGGELYYHKGYFNHTRETNCERPVPTWKS